MMVTRRAGEEAACGERVEGAFEQRRVPPVEEIAGDDQVIDSARAAMQSS